MKKSIYFISLFMSIVVLCSSNAYSAVGDYRTRAGITGNWNASNVWQMYYNPGSGTGWYDVSSFPTSANGAITILAGCNITVTADINLDEVNVKGNLTLNSGVTITINDGTGTDLFIDNTSSSYANLFVYGIIINQGTLSKTYGNIYYYNNATYKHAYNGGSVEDASWSSNSTCEITGITTNNISNLDQSFGNFTWNCISQTGVFNLPAIGTISGNFTLSSTGSGGIKLSESADVSLSIYGNYTQTNGNFYPSGSSANNIISVLGNFSFTGGYISSPGSGSCTFYFWNPSPAGGAQSYTKSAPPNAAYYQKIHFTVSNNAILDMGSSIIDNGSSGNFTLNSGCGLKTTNPNGITASGASGCIQLTGSRSYDPGAHYTFYANGNQSSGYEFSTAVSGSVTIGSSVNNTNFTVSSPTQIDGSFVIIKGTVANPNLSYGSSGILEYRGTALQTMGNNEWVASGVPNLKINNSSGVTMNTSKTVSSTLTLTSGALSIGGNTLNLNGAISTASGSITGGLTSNINIGGSISTTLPGVTNGLGNLSINRPAYTISLTGGITVYGTMTMTAGNFSLNGGTLSYGNSGTLKYNGAGSTQTCSNAEFPSSNGPYNLYIDNSSGVNFHASKILNGSLTLNNGAFSIGANTLTINGFIVKNSGSLTGGSSSNITFGENASIISFPAVTNGLNNLSVSRSGGVQVTGAVTVYGTLTLTNGSITISGGSIAYGSNGILQYEGSLTQTTSNIEFPSVNGPKKLVSGNTTGLILHANRALNGTLSLIEGNFALSGNTITLYDSITTSGGIITGGTTSGIDFEGNTASTSIPNEITLQNLTINRANGISLSGSATIEGTLFLLNGSLSIGGNTLTINGDISQTSGGLNGTSASNIVFGSIGAMTNLPGTTVGKLTVNRINGVIMTGNVTVEGTLKIGAGNLNIGSNTLIINGTVIGTSLTGGSTSNIIVGGTAANFTLPAITLGSFTLNRANGISLGGNMDIYGNVTMTNGSILPGGNLVIYHGLNTSLIYNGSSLQTTSDVEFPTFNGPNSLSIIHNLSGVKLHDSRTINGMLTLLNSVFTIGDNLILTLNGPINNSSASIQGGVFSNLILSGSLPTTLFPTASLYNLTIDRSGNIILNGDVDVQGILSLTTGLFDLTNHKLKIHQPIVGNQDNLITSSVSNFEISGSATNMNIGAAENIRISNINNLYVSNTNPSGIALNGDLKLNGLLMVNTASKFSINSGKKLTVNGPIILNDTVCLIVKSDSTGTGSLIDHGITYIFPASAKVERYISGNKFHMISLPISNTIQGGTQPGQTGNVFLNCSLDNYDENLNTWYGLTQNDNITPDMGYITQYYYLGNAPDYKTIKFSGNLNTGSKSFLIKNTNQGYNLLPNPYPSSVNWDNPLGWERSGLVINSGGYDIWIWNPNPGINNWGTYNSGTHIGTNDVTNHITVGQSFFVQALFFNSILTVNDNAREHSDQIFLKNASQLNNILKLKISNGISSDEAVVYFDMLNQLNTGSLKWMSMAAESPNLYMPKNNQNYAVNILPSLNSNTVIPLNLAAGINGNYSLTWQHTDSFESNMNILLEDIQQHVFTDLRNNSVYTFNANIADNPSRFLLHFNNSINNIPIEKTDQTLIYAYGNTIYVSYTDTRDASIELYNVSGQLLYERTINNSRHEIPLNLPNGIFFVKFSGQQKSTYQKIVIQK